MMPNNSLSRNGTTANHTMDDRSIATSQKKEAISKIIIRIGSWAIVNTNIALKQDFTISRFDDSQGLANYTRKITYNAGPNVRKAHPKNSASVIFIDYFLYFLISE